MSEKLPFLDRAMGDISGWVLVRLGKRAHDRGDHHEYAHCLAALRYGNSNHDKYACELTEDILQPLTLVEEPR